MAKISTVYTIRNSRGDLVTTIPSGTRDSSTSLVFHGKGAPEYGLDRDQNLVYRLENFSNTTSPLNPIDGQLWWKTGDQMYVFDESAGSPGGDWASVVPPPLALGFFVEAGDGLTGGGFPTLSPLQVVLDVGAGTGIQLGSPIDSVSTKDSEIVHDNLMGYFASDHIDHSTVTITAGRGLTGGGPITASMIFDVVVADFGGLFAYGSPPSLSIGGNVEGTGVPQGSPINVVRTSGDQRIAGIKTFSDQLLAGAPAPLSLPVATNLVYDSVVTMPLNVVGLAWTEDGTKLSYNQGTGTFYTYSAATPWSLSGLVLTDTSTFATTKASYGHAWNPDGTKFYTCSQTGDQLSQWDVPTPNDISSIVDKNNPEASVYEFESTGMQWIQDGSILASLWDANGGWLAFFDCSTPYDLSTAVKRAGQHQFQSMGPVNQWQNGMVCSDDGTRVFCLDYNTEKLHQADLSTPFLPTSGVISLANDFTLNDPAIRPRGLFVSANENSIYVGRNTGKKIERYTWTDDANSAAAPAYSFVTDPDTGFYRAGSNTLAFATGGLERFQVESDGVLSASTASYTSLVAHDDDIPNKQYVDNQAAAGSAPTSNTFTGTSFITGLNGAHTYIVTVYGKVRYKGTGNTYLDGIDIRSGTSLGVGTILAQTPRQWINWPDGDIPIHNCFVVDMSGFTSLNCQLNSITGDAGGLGHNDYANQMTAVQLTNSIGTGSPGTGGGLSVTISPSSIFDYEASCPQTTVSISVSVGGGTGPYTYLWSWNTGGAGMTINSPSSSSTTITKAGSGNEQGTLNCLVTDTITPFAVGDDVIGVEMECGT